MKNVVVIGGGTGTRTVVEALKWFSIHISAIIAMTDNGGSSGVIRETMNMVPLGDLRQSLAVLSPIEFRGTPSGDLLMQHRFTTGIFEGHVAGNIILAAYQEIYGAYDVAIDATRHILQVNGHSTVIPVTTELVDLCLRRPNGTVVVGEKGITNTVFGRKERPDLFLQPLAPANSLAIKAIKTADLIVIAPGNLYSSVIPALLVDGIADAIHAARATKVYVCNLVTKPGQTDRFYPRDFVSEIERLANPLCVDVVIYNNRAGDRALLRANNKPGERWVPADVRKRSIVSDDRCLGFCRAIGADLIDPTPVPQNPGERHIHDRNRIRHKRGILGLMLMELARDPNWEL